VATCSEICKSVVAGTGLTHCAHTLNEESANAPRKSNFFFIESDFKVKQKYN
jgi:hypothetical protein